MVVESFSPVFCLYALTVQHGFDLSTCQYVSILKGGTILVVYSFFYPNVVSDLSEFLPAHQIERRR